MVTQPAVSLFSCLDYRAYLRDWFEAAKKTRASMSYRKFSKRAGLKSWNFIMLVMQGKRNLTDDTALKVAKGLKLNKQETEFFLHLVHYTQAQDHEDRDRAYRSLLRSRKYQQLQPLKKSQYEYCSHWYHAVIRELITAPGFDGTAEWIADHLIPKISVQEVEQSLGILEKLKLIRKGKKGRWTQSETLVSTGAELASVELFTYHRNMLDLTKEMLDRVPGSQRDMSALTLGVAKSRLPQLKKKIQRFRREILKIAADEAEPEEVVQLNLYFFPVTRSDDAP